MHLKMMINFLQIISLNKDLQLNWPEQIRNFFEAQLKIGDPSNEFFSFECLLSNDVIDIIYLKLILIFFLPYFMILLLILLFAIMSLLKKRTFFNYVIPSCTINCFILQPIVINACFGILSCSEIDPQEYYLTFFKNSECYTAHHTFFVHKFL